MGSHQILIRETHMRICVCISTLRNFQVTAALQKGSGPGTAGKEAPTI